MHRFDLKFDLLRRKCFLPLLYPLLYHQSNYGLLRAVVSGLSIEPIPLEGVHLQVEAYCHCYLAAPLTRKHQRGDSATGLRIFVYPKEGAEVLNSLVTARSASVMECSQASHVLFIEILSRMRFHNDFHHLHCALRRSQHQRSHRHRQYHKVVCWQAPLVQQL